MFLRQITPHFRRLTLFNRARFSFTALPHQSRDGNLYEVQCCFHRKYSFKNDAIQTDSDAKRRPREKFNVPYRVTNPDEVQKEKNLLLLKNDPDTFGTFSRNVSDSLSIENTEEDPGDTAEREYNENAPTFSQKLSIKGYSDLIKDHLKNYRIKEAIDVLEVRMIKIDRVKPDNYIYNILISECGRLGYVKKAFALYNRMKQRGLKVTGATYTALFNGCATTPYLDDGLQRARHLREIMLGARYQPNATNYHAMMKAFGRCGDVETVFELMDEMKETKVRLELRSFNFLLHAAGSDHEHGFRHALMVWHKIYRHGMKPDIYTFNLMLNCTRNCGIGDVEATRELIKNVLLSSKKNSPPPKIALRCDQREEQKLIMIDNKNEPNESEHSLGENRMVSNEECKDQTPNLLARNPHLGSLVSLGEIKSAEERFLLIGGLHGFLHELDLAKELPDVKTFAQMLEMIPPTYAAEKELLQIMRRYGVRTNVDFFNLLMKKRALRLDYEGAEKVLDMITAARLSPDIATYGILALGCRTSRDANTFLQRLQEKRIRPNNEILGALLGNACHSHSYSYIMDVLYRLKEEALKPSVKFMKKIEKYQFTQYLKFKESTEHTPQEHVDEFSQFSKDYKKWKRQMGFGNLKRKELLNLLEEKPWVQFKEEESVGVEPLKNRRTRKLWKRGHVLVKFRDAKLDDEGGYRLQQKTSEWKYNGPLENESEEDTNSNRN